MDPIRPSGMENKHLDYTSPSERSEALEQQRKLDEHPPENEKVNQQPDLHIERNEEVRRAWADLTGADASDSNLARESASPIGAASATMPADWFAVQETQQISTIPNDAGLDSSLSDAVDSTDWTYAQFLQDVGANLIDGVALSSSETRMVDAVSDTKWLDSATLLEHTELSMHVDRRLQAVMDSVIWVGAGV